MITSVDVDSWVADYLEDPAFKVLFNAAWRLCQPTPSIVVGFGPETLSVSR